MPLGSDVRVGAKALGGDREACTAAGFDAFLVKPFDFGDLARTIDHVCPAPATLCGKRSRAS